ncbi:MAG: hypothetical protein RL641_365 [Candidatus Parcubacteria bacterium]|jgi:hypothetical protein
MEQKLESTFPTRSKFLLYVSDNSNVYSDIVDHADTYGGIIGMPKMADFIKENINHFTPEYIDSLTKQERRRLRHYRMKKYLVDDFIHNISDPLCPLLLNAIREHGRDRYHHFCQNNEVCDCLKFWEAYSQYLYVLTEKANLLRKNNITQLSSIGS